MLKITLKKFISFIQYWDFVPKKKFQKIS
jgi:hypothetical protein